MNITRTRQPIAIPPRRLAALDPEAVHRQRWRILAVLCLSMFLVVVDNTIVNVALPTIARDLDASTSQLQWIVDAYALVFSGLLLAAGALSDRLGRKGALQIGLVVFGATSGLAAAASSSTELIIARGAMGVGAALVFPATLAILSNTFVDPVERAKAIGVWSGVVGIAVAVGPVTGGLLLEHFWWGSIFFVNIPIVLGSLAAVATMVPPSRDPEAHSIDRLGFLLSIAAITTLVYTVIEAPESGWTSTPTLLGFGVAALATSTFVAHELRVEQPLLDLTVFTNRRFAVASLAITLAAFALFGVVFLMTQYLQFVRGDDTLTAGLHSLPYAAATIVVAPIGAALATRYGPRPIVSTGLVSVAAGMLMTSLLDSSSGYWREVVPAMVVMAAGVALIFAPATEVIMSSLPPAKAGVGSAVNDTTRELGGTLGVAVVGSVFSSVYGPNVARQLRELGVHPEAVEAASDSMGSATAIATEAGPAGAPIVEAARSAFVDGMSAGTLVAAGVALGGAALTWRFLPGRPSAVTDVTDVTDVDHVCDA